MCGLIQGLKSPSLPGGGHSRASSFSFLCELTVIQGRETQVRRVKNPRVLVCVCLVYIIGRFQSSK